MKNNISYLYQILLIMIAMSCTDNKSGYDDKKTFPIVAGYYYNSNDGNRDFPRYRSAIFNDKQFDIKFTCEKGNIWEQDDDNLIKRVRFEIGRLGRDSVFQTYAVNSNDFVKEFCVKYDWQDGNSNIQWTWYRYMYACQNEHIAKLKYDSTYKVSDSDNKRQQEFLRDRLFFVSRDQEILVECLFVRDQKDTTKFFITSGVYHSTHDWKIQTEGDTRLIEHVTSLVFNENQGF